MGVLSGMFGGLAPGATKGGTPSLVNMLFKTPPAFRLLAEDEIAKDKRLNALRQAQLSPLDALSGELGIFSMENGGIATERSQTVTHPLLYGGAPTNIPMLVQGQSEDAIARILAGTPTREDEERAVHRALARIKAGLPLPKFNTIDEAVAAAKARSKGK